MELEVLGRHIHAYCGHMIGDLFVTQLVVVLDDLMRRRCLIIQLSDAVKRIAGGLNVTLREPFVQ